MHLKMDQISNSSKRNKNEGDSLASQRVYKKTSANSVLTLYLGSRDLISRRGVVEPLKGVIYVDPKFICSQKIYGQLTLTFRYGREDEEVMGLKFCNEAVISLKQIWPKVNYDDDSITPLQQALIDRLGSGAHPFTLEVGMLAPPSVQLIPAKKYNGAPIGTSYDIRVFMNDLNDEKFQRRTTVKLGIRLMHKIPSDLRSIQQTNPTYTSLPKSIRLRLSPKHIKFHHNHHHNSKHQNLSTTTTVTSKSTPSSIDFSTYNPPPTAINVVDTHPLTLSSSSSSAATTSSSSSSLLPLSNFKTKSHEEIRSNYTVDNKVTVKSNDTKIGVPSCSTSESLATLKGPEGCINKPFLWTEGRVSLKASLNKSAYAHGEKIHVTVDIKNNSRKIIRKIRVFAVQHVDVCMFSNGKFKNVVADVNENHQIKPNETYNHTYEIIPIKGPTKNWIAVEGAYTNNSITSTSPTCTGTQQQPQPQPQPQQQQQQNLSQVEVNLLNENNYKIASSAHRGPTTADERNVFAIYVSYYVKVKLTLSGMGGEASLKLPFILGHVDDDDDDDDENSENSKKNDDNNSGIIYDMRNIKSSSMEQKTKMIINNSNGGNSKNLNNCGSSTSNHTSKIINKYQTTSHHNNKDNIIEEEVHEEHDTISLVEDEEVRDCNDGNDDDDDDDTDNDNDEHNDEKKKLENEKHIQDKILLKRYKMQRSSYSRSCEDIDTFTKNSVNSICAKAVVHRQASETND